MTPEQMKELEARLRDMRSHLNDLDDLCCLEDAADLIRQMAESPAPHDDTAPKGWCLPPENWCLPPVEPTSARMEHMRAMLATAPPAPQPARVPMTDEQIENCLPETAHISSNGGRWPRATTQTFYDFARAIEAAHGIRSEK
jgi:hypothetical protein